MTMIWLAVSLFGLYKIVVDGEMLYAALTIGGLMFIFQRRPYTRDLQFCDIRLAQFGAVDSVFGQWEILSLIFDSQTVQLVPAQAVPHSVRYILTGLSRFHNST